MGDVSFGQLLPLILLGFVGWKLYGFFKRRGKDDTLDGYLKRHPDARRNGRLHCHNCDGNSLHVRGLGRTFWSKDVINAHICRQCGTVLYRSVSKMT